MNEKNTEVLRVRMSAMYMELYMIFWVIESSLEVQDASETFNALDTEQQDQLIQDSQFNIERGEWLQAERETEVRGRNTKMFN